MNHETYKRLQKNASIGSYEIIELNESEPIIFKKTKKKHQEIYSQNNRSIILVIPNSHKYSHGKFK